MQQITSFRTSALRPRELHPQLFWQPIPDFLRQPVMDMPRSQLGRIDHRHRSGRGDGNDQPDQGRESESGKRSNLEPEGMARLKIADRREDRQKHGSRGGREDNQRNVNQAVQLLTAAAVLAGGEMQLIVSAHLRRQAGDVIPPSRKNFPYDGFDRSEEHTSELQSLR